MLQNDEIKSVEAIRMVLDYTKKRKENNRFLTIKNNENRRYKST